MGEFDAQAIANTTWAFSKLDLLNKLLFAALVRAAERHMGEFNAQNIANTACAFATLFELDEPLFAALAMAVY